MKKFLYLVIPYGFVLLTNQYYSLNDSIQQFKQYDISSYVVLAEKCISCPDAGYYARRQRFIWPKIAAYTSQVLKIDLDKAFLIWTIVWQSVLLAILHKGLTKLKVSDAIRVIVANLVILNPHLLRYHLAYSGMLSDQVFIASVGMLAYSLIARKVPIYYVSLLFCITSRQTIIFALPAIILSFWILPTWRHLKLETKAFHSILSLASVLLVYGTLYFYAGQRLPGVDGSQVYMWFLDWLFQRFNILGLVSWAAHFLFIHFYPVVMILTARIFLEKPKIMEGDVKRIVFCLFIIYAGSLAQIITQNPDLAVGIIRYSTHGIYPLYLAVALYFSCKYGAFFEKIDKKLLVASIAVMAIGSLHYQHSLAAVLGVSKAYFAVIYPALCIVSAAMLLIGIKSYRRDMIMR